MVLRVETHLACDASVTQARGRICVAGHTADRYGRRATTSPVWARRGDNESYNGCFLSTKHKSVQLQRREKEANMSFRSTASRRSVREQERQSNLTLDRVSAVAKVAVTANVLSEDECHGQRATNDVPSFRLDGGVKRDIRETRNAGTGMRSPNLGQPKSRERQATKTDRLMCTLRAVKVTSTSKRTGK